jgi:hypothetical protein
MNFDDEYYENLKCCGDLLSEPRQKERLQKTLALIPDHLHYIFDIRLIRLNMVRGEQNPLFGGWCRETGNN